MNFLRCKLWRLESPSHFSPFLSSDDFWNFIQTLTICPERPQLLALYITKEITYACFCMLNTHEYIYSSSFDNRCDCNAIWQGYKYRLNSFQQNPVYPKKLWLWFPLAIVNHSRMKSVGNDMSHTKWGSNRNIKFLTCIPIKPDIFFQTYIMIFPLF